jgi:hypothetical protein
MHNYLAGQKRTKLRNAALAGGRFLVSFKRALGVLVAGGMKYHRAHSLTAKLSQVLSESRSAIAKERNETARSKRVEKQEEERKELRKAVKELWERHRRSMTLRVKHPLVYYLESNKRMLNYRNASVRRRAEERREGAC